MCALHPSKESLERVKANIVSQVEACSALVKTLSSQFEEIGIRPEAIEISWRSNDRDSLFGTSVVPLIKSMTIEGIKIDIQDPVKALSKRTEDSD